MAASSRSVVSTASPTKSRGRIPTGGKRGRIVQPRSPVPTSEEEEVSSHSPVRQMKQVRKSRSEKGKMKIYGSTQDIGLGNTKWHISLPNIRDTQLDSREHGANLSESQSQSQGSLPSLPPPPSNPPPILKPASGGNQGRGRELVKSASAGAINIINPARIPGRSLALQSGALKPAESREENGRPKKGPPPKLPPPYSPKARAATVVSAAIQEHMQSSTRSAPGALQNSEASERGGRPSAVVSSKKRSESAKNALLMSVIPEDQRETQKALKSDPLSAVHEDGEPELTASMEGGVKLLARYFSARGKEGTPVQSPVQPKRGEPGMVRPVKGRQLFRKAARKATGIPETCNEENEVPTEDMDMQERRRRLPPIQSSASNDPDEKYEMLQNVGSMISTGSPTHVSIFSWVVPNPDSKSDMCDVSKRRYQNVFDNDDFARFDKTGLAKREKDSSLSPKSPFKEYQNVLVDTATLERVNSDAQSSREGSHKEKKPIPLPRTQSKERYVGGQFSRQRHLATSDSGGALTISIPHDNHGSEYVEMASSSESSSAAIQEVITSPTSPGIVVMGALDPEWRDNFEEMIQREIEMTDGFSDSDEPKEAGQEQESAEKRKQTKMPVVPPSPFVPVKKSTLKKTQSHNPNGSNIPRRNMPKEKRELRKGVCSDSDQLEPDDYVAMKSAQSKQAANNTPLPSLTSQSEMTSSLSMPKANQDMDPRSSAYYLKILPPKPGAMVKPPEYSPLATEATTPIKHYYIELDVPDDNLDEAQPAMQVQGGASRGPTLPPKSSPVHVPSTALVVPADGKRKLKYPKISIGPATHAKVVGGNVRKIPYTHVKVDADLVKGSSAFRSQGSIFAKEMINYVDRPLPPTPSDGAIYYKTVNHPLSHIPAMRQVWHHEYIEIDENELNKKATPPLKAADGWINIHAAGGPVRVGDTKQPTQPPSSPPPPVPKRPSCPYVEIDGEEMEEMAANLPPEEREGLVGKLRGLWGVSVGPKEARKLGPPPVVPSRPDNAGRQRSLSNSGEYAYPVIAGLKLWMNLQRGEGGKAYFAPRVPSTSSNGSKSPMEAIMEKGALHEHPPTLPPKTESLLREQKGYTPRKPSPYLVPITSVKSRDNLVVSQVPSPKLQRPKSPKDVVSSMQKELLGDDAHRDDAFGDRAKTKTELPEHLKQKKKAMFPPYHSLPYTMSVEPKPSTSSNSSPPKVPKKQRKLSKEETNSTQSISVDIEEKDEGFSSPFSGNSPPDTLAVKKARLQDRIDRTSLAMIMRNRSAIEEQLERENGSPKGQRKQMPASPEGGSKKDVSIVRSLGDILLDVDALLQRRMCSEDDLLAAIETQLNIKLVKKQPRDRERKRSNEGGSLEDSVQVTEQDVEDVVDFMNKNQFSPHQSPSAPVGRGEGGDGAWGEASISSRSESESLSSPKHRSSTFIVNAVNDVESSWQQENATDLQRDGLAGDHIEEADSDSSPDKHMRDSRSSSIGLKPLRRVMARRKTNPASDMANLSASKWNRLFAFAPIS